MSTWETWQRRAALTGALVIDAAALVLTYEGTMKFCQEHGALGWRGAAVAAMNDLAVLIGIVWPQRVLQAIAALCAVFTIGANLAHAAPGVSGLIVALIPPALAVLLTVALESVARAPKPQADETQTAAESEPVEAEPELQAEPEPAPSDQEARDEYGAHATERNGERESIHLVNPYVELTERLSAPAEGWTKETVLARIAEEGWTTAQAVQYTGVSKATVNRWKKEQRAA